MSRKKLTEKTLSENQEGLFALANALLVDIDVTIYAKLVFGYIIKLSGRDISKEDGYAHVSNAEMRKGCEIGSDTMTNAVVELVNAGLITIERGKKRSKGEKGVENRYFLPDEIKEKIHFKTNSIDISTEKENISTEKENISTEKKNISTEKKNISTEKIQQIDELLKRIEALELRINELTEENRILSEKVEAIAEKRKSAMDMEVDMEINSCNSSCINKVKINNSSSSNHNTVATGTGGLLPDDELFQDEPEEKTDVEMENEVKQKRTYTSMENNEYVDKCLNRFDVMLKYLYSIKDCKTYDSYTNDILRFWESIDQSRFTEKQRGLIEKKCERWAKISDGKERFFNGNAGKSDDESISIEPECEEYADAEHISMGEETNLNAGTEENGDSQSQCEDAPNPRRQTKTSDEISEWVLKQCKRFPDYASWEKDFEKKIVKKYTSDWANNAEAGKYYNFCTGIADKYFKEKVTDDDAGIDYLLKASEEEIAPWEEESKPVQMNQEDWYSKYGHLIKY